MNEILKIKTAFGSIAYVWSDDLSKAKETGRMVYICEKDGSPKFVDGERKRMVLGNLLTDPGRTIVSYTETFPDGSRRKGYWYADDMKNGLPRFMAG